MFNKVFVLLQSSHIALFCLKLDLFHTVGGGVHEMNDSNSKSTDFRFSRGRKTNAPFDTRIRKLRSEGVRPAQEVKVDSPGFFTR